jgi:hypothetical protein
MTARDQLKANIKAADAAKKDALKARNQSIAATRAARTSYKEAVVRVTAAKQALVDFDNGVRTP